MAYRRESPSTLSLTPEQQSEVTALIPTAGLEPTEFTVSEYCLLGTLVSALIHTPTGYVFRFEFLETALGQNRVSVFSVKVARTDEVGACSRMAEATRPDKE